MSTENSMQDFYGGPIPYVNLRAVQVYNTNRKDEFFIPNELQIFRSHVKFYPIFKFCALNFLVVSNTISTYSAFRKHIVTLHSSSLEFKMIKSVVEELIINDSTICLTLITMKRSFLLVIDNEEKREPTASPLEGLSLAIGDHSSPIWNSLDPLASSSLACRLSKSCNNNRPVYVSNNHGVSDQFYMKVFQFVRANYQNKTLANTLKEAGCQVFLNVLDKIDGAKDLVLSSAILVQLDSICGMQKLRQNAVDKVYKLQADAQFSDTKNRVYVIRTSMDEVKLVATQINDYLTRGGDNDQSHFDIKFWIIFVPRLIHYCELALEEEGIYEYVNILECPLGLIPIEYDVYSLEDDRIFKTLFLNRDMTPLTDVVHSIQQLQLLSGNVFEIHGLGRYAEKVAKKMDEFNIKYGHQYVADPDVPSSFSDIFLIDRDSDYASVLLSQLNYEGILDESFSITCNKLEYTVQTNQANSNVNPTTDTSDKNKQPVPAAPIVTKEVVKHSLSRESDPIFRDIRDNHFSTVFSLVKLKSNEMRKKYNSSKDLNISSLKNFVANDLKNLQMEYKCLSIHISACEEIMKDRNKYNFGEQMTIEQYIIDGIETRKCLEFISKMIVHQLHKHVPLRLLSLLSLTQGGIQPKEYRKYLTLYCENYGIFNNATFANLKKLGLINELDSTLANRLVSLTGGLSSFTERASGRMASVLPRRGNFCMIMKKFQLIPEMSDAGYNIREPKDPGFVFGGSYIPLVCQLVNHVVLGKHRDGSSAATNSNNSTSTTSPHHSSLNNNQVINVTPELLKLLPHSYFRRRQTFMNNLPNNANTSKAINDLQNRPSERALLLYFIGGVTYAEISALRFVAKQRKIKIAIATTSIINGNKLINSMFPIDHIS